MRDFSSSCICPETFVQVLILGFGIDVSLKTLPPSGYWAGYNDPRLVFCVKFKWKFGAKFKFSTPLLQCTNVICLLETGNIELHMQSIYKSTYISHL